MKDGKIKRYLLSVWDNVFTRKLLHDVRKNYSISVMTPVETVDYIKKHNCSIARYGDGEFELMLRRGAPNFQKGSEELTVALLRVLDCPPSNLLICVPGGLATTKGFSKGGKKFWENWAISYQESTVTVIREIMGHEYRFGDTNISRPFTPYKDTINAEVIFPRLKDLWNDREILIVEGDKTRLGVGNDLFDNVKSTKRLLCPAENAFDAYDQILEKTISCWNGELVILALGPTATVLASDLSKNGIQALDLGHIDIQYEWYLAGTSFVPVKGKYTNETLGGRQPEICEDETYLSQIIAEVK